MTSGDEWVTTRPLRVRLLEETVIRPAEIMGKKELTGMLERGEIPREAYDTILAKQQLHE